MNSPPRPFARTRRAVGAYNRSYNGRPFIPRRREYIGGFHTIVVRPEDGSFFYRMDRRKPFSFEGETGAAVFGVDRNSYFGIQPSDIMNAYKTHTHLYVSKAITPIVLIDMGHLGNIHRLLAEPTPEEIRHSVSVAFPIKDDGLVHRYSAPAEDHDDEIDHDRRILEYICTLPGVDGYYVSVEGLHPEIGFCRGSLPKLEVVDMFRIRAEEAPRGRPGNSRRTKRNRSPNNNFRPAPISFGNRFDFAGGKRRSVKRSNRKTQRRLHTHRK